MIGNLKRRVYAYADYRAAEARYRQVWDIESSRLRSLMLTAAEPGVDASFRAGGRALTVSLTTYGRRIYDVPMTIESLMRQTVRPSKIVLWLDDTLQNATLPLILKRQEERGLQVRFCPDLRSYKKLVPALGAFPDDIIITVDDDVIYHYDLIENLLNTHALYPEAVCCCEAKRMLFRDGAPLPYSDWERVQEGGCSPLNFAVGCGGVLYPPGALASEVVDSKLFMELCPHGDDLWFKAMATLAGTPCAVTPQGIHEYPYIDNPLWQDKGLTQVNCNRRANDTQLAALWARYPAMQKLAKP